MRFDFALGLKEDDPRIIGHPNVSLYSRFKDDGLMVWDSTIENVVAFSKNGK